MVYRCTSLSDQIGTPSYGVRHGECGSNPHPIACVSDALAN